MFCEIELEKARELLLVSAKELKTEKVELENSCGRILAEDIYATLNVPSFPKSPLDGFALRASDTIGSTRENPVHIKIIDEVRAGDTRYIDKLPLGCGVKILTGAPLPLEANVVIRKEDVAFINKEIIITPNLMKNTNIINCGSDLKEGEHIFSPGERIGPYHLGLLAAQGLVEITVFQKPKVGIISTGTELKTPGENLLYGQIYNSNMYTLKALVENKGCFPQNLGIVPDNIEKINLVINEALENFDLVITTGGASVGDYDLIETVLKRNNAKILFNKLGIKPGSAIICGILRGKLVIGLSGNPSAALIGFELLVRPLLKKLRGIKDLSERYLDVELAEGFPKKTPQRRFLRVKVIWQDGRWIAYETGRKETSILKSMLGCNALVDLPQGSGPIVPKTIVKAILLEEEMLCYHR